MKVFSKIILAVIAIFGLSATVNAVSSNIYAYQSSTRFEYIDGLPLYYNRSSSYNLYVLNNNTYYNGNTYLYNPIEVNSGFAYIINNSNVTNNSNKNYYIAQVAILWYEDYLNGTNTNISKSLKDEITKNTNDTICYYITKLVNNAKNYSKNNNLINFVDNEVTFSRNGDYYYSNVIEVEVNGLNTKPNVTTYNAPSGTTIINNTVTNNGTGSFQLRIPASNMTNTYNKDFTVNVTGNGYNYTYYEYSSNNSDRAIYAYPYSTNYNTVEDSIVVKISELSNTSVRIKVVDYEGKFINGIKYAIYSGNCTNNTCKDENLVYTFTTKNTYIDLNGILKQGTYTLERLTNTNKYLPSKETIYINDSTSMQYITIEEDYSNYTDEDIDFDTEYDILLLSPYTDSKNVIKIYKSNGQLLDSYRSDKDNHIITVKEGNYYIVDTNDTLELNFKISNGILYVNDKKNTQEVNVINLNNYLKRTTNDEEITEEDIYTDEDGNIHIDNLDGIDSIDIETNVETSTKVEWLNNIIDCPITSLSATVKYIIGAIILGAGLYLVIRNVKKQKNNN